MLGADFVKGHGLGNDYIVVDGERFGIPLTPERVRLLCHRNLGLGSDGVLEVTKRVDGFFARIWNPDGSEAERSGNGLRIAAKFLSDHGYTIESTFVIVTAAGPVTTEVYRRAGRVYAVRLEMGRASIDRAIRSLAIERRRLDVTVVSVGNPHCVIFGEPLTRERLFAIGPLVERHAQFPQRINVQIAAAESRASARALVWERGAGHTLASGTSACAVATACFDRGLVDGKVTVLMEGGQLEVEVGSDLSLIMTGPAEEVYVGTLSPDLRQRLLEMQ
ncbi:MAG: diaminopimelate epimerase [Candidatus Eisenbacteria bacterium]|uniref:Diaminopimelate epimerase n=1 Tax=Eiseniibacteriota bacterium TaxID=2212470 RepID=A0A538T4U3_UNCEI|nr:MAG: diaminopimelate epimerase [Candidatus Eisenbacteria bacterium]